MTERLKQLALLPEIDGDREKPAALGLPPPVRDMVLRRLRALQPILNHDAQALGIPMKALLKQLQKGDGVPGRTRQLWARQFKEGGREALIPKRPGPSRGHLKDDPSVRAFIEQRVLEGKSKAVIASEVEAYLQTKQEAPGNRLTHVYSRYHRTTIGRYIDSLPAKFKVAREGPPAVKVAAGYIDRHYDDEFAGDGWCVDEWDLDAYPYEDSNHSIVYNYGAKNPVLYVLSAIDERTTFILDWMLTIQVDADTLTLVERMLRKYPIPLRLVADRAGRFRQLVRGSRITRETGKLVDIIAGPLGLLGVKPRGSEEKNPRANRIERTHGIYAPFARRDFGASWRPPRKVRGFQADMREATEIDERVERHYREHIREGKPSELLPLSQVARFIAAWVEEINNSKTKAKGCKGMTRRGAFNFFQPPEDQVARRRASEAMLDEAFAERETHTVRVGGIIEWSDHKRYDADALLGRNGEEVTAVRYRRDHSRLIVTYEGQTFPARLRPQVGINEETLLADEMKIQNRRRRLLSGQPPEENAAPGAQAPTPDSSPLEISSSEWIMRRRGTSEPSPMRTSDALARAALKIQEES